MDRPSEPDGREPRNGSRPVPVDLRLVEAARRGDRAAFDDLDRRHRRLVHGIVVARVRYDEVEDLVQDVFVKAFERLGSLRDPASFAPWLAAMARRRAIDHLRARRDHAELADDTAAPPAARDAAFEVLDALRALPEAYRETLALRLVEGLTGPEIAALTGLSPGSVRVNLHRGFRLLRERLGPETGEVRE